MLENEFASAAFVFLSGRMFFFAVTAVAGLVAVVEAVVASSSSSLPSSVVFEVFTGIVISAVFVAQRVARLLCAHMDDVSRVVARENARVYVTTYAQYCCVHSPT